MLNNPQLHLDPFTLVEVEFIFYILQDKNNAVRVLGIIPQSNPKMIQGFKKAGLKVDQ